MADSDQLKPNEPYDTSSDPPSNAKLSELEYEFEEIIDVQPSPIDPDRVIPQSKSSGTLSPDEIESPPQSVYGTPDGPRSPIVEHLEEQAQALDIGRGGNADFDSSLPSLPNDNSSQKGLQTTTTLGEGNGGEEGEAKGNEERLPQSSPIRQPIGDVTYLVADDVELCSGIYEVDKFTLDDLIDEHEWGKSLNREVKEQIERKKKMKRRDPAVVVEIPKGPSAQAYEVAHNNILDDKYFQPLFEDDDAEIIEIDIDNPSKWSGGNNRAKDTPPAEPAEIEAPV